MTADERLKESQRSRDIGRLHLFWEDYCDGQGLPKIRPMDADDHRHGLTEAQQAIGAKVQELLSMIDPKHYGAPA